MGIQKNRQQQRNFIALASAIINRDDDGYSCDEGDIYYNEVFEKEEFYPESEGSDCSYEFSRHPRVSFAMTIKRHDIIGLDSYTAEEKQKCWYTSEEKKSRASKRERIIARMEAGRPAKASMTYRGLEGWTEAGSLKLDRRIAKCLHAVMDEQDHQWTIEQDDFERIAEISQALSSVCKEEALQRAVEDRREAVEAWKDCETVTLCSQSSGEPDSPIKLDRRSLLRRSKSKSFNRGEDKWTQGSNQSLLDNKWEQACSKDPPGTLRRLASIEPPLWIE